MSQTEVTARMEENKKQLNFIEPSNVENTFFQWYDQAREKYQWKTWVVATIEFIGTFLMTFMIIAPSTFGLYNAETYGNSDFGKGIELIFSFMFMRAMWVAFGIWVLIILFNKISVNINPAITIAEMAAHNHLRAQGVVKILAQVGGAIVASYIALYLGLAWMEDVTSIDSIQLGVHNFYQSDPNSQMGFIIDDNEINIAEHQVYIAVQFFMEFILTFLLLLAVFSTDHINWSIRSCILAIVLLVLVSIGIRTDNIALNPARLIGPAMASATYNLNHAGAEIDKGALATLPVMLIAELSAALLMYFIQGIGKTKFENVNAIKENETIKLAWAKILILEVLLEEATIDKKTLYEMSLNELELKTKKLKIKNIEELTREDLIDKISFVLVKKYLNNNLKIKENKLSLEKKQLIEKTKEIVDVVSLEKETNIKQLIKFKKISNINWSSINNDLKKRTKTIKNTIIKKNIN